MKLIAVTVALVSILLGTVVFTEENAAGNRSLGTARNEAPRIGAFKARIGRVYDEAQGRFRSRGLVIRFRLCDDGPQSTEQAEGLIRLDHHWGDRTHTWFAASELAPLITWDVHFDMPHCIDSVPWTSTLPADLPGLRAHPCYTVLVRVRDPGGRWSNTARVGIRKCPR